MVRKEGKKVSSGGARTKKVSWKELDPAEFQSLIAKKAYEMYEKRGYSHGDDLGDWFKAEKAVKRNLR